MLQLKRPDLLRQQAYINGKWVGSTTDGTSEISNPATGEVIGTVPCLGATQTRAAIEAANDAWAAWRSRSPENRAAILRKWYELMMDNQEDLARIMTAEQGKPLPEARGEIGYGAAFFEWYAEEGKRAYGEIIPTNNNDRRLVVLREPIGVCAAITPWNFPSSMITRKAAAALAAGCPIVLKPAPETPFSALALAVLAQEAGVPAGVFSIVTGDAVAIGGELTSNPLVRKLSFTGSTEVGRLLYAQCASTVKKLSLELGGNAPFIVFDDADLDAAVEGLMLSKYRNTGQTCVCANRIYVQDGIYDEFARKLAVAVGSLKVGDGSEEGVNQGPLIDDSALAKVQRHVADAVGKGGKVLAGGHVHALGGTFYEPTVISDVSPDMLVAREETFGPVAPLFRFTDEAEVINQANATEYGLAAYLYSKDVGRVWRVSEALEYGMIGVNVGVLSTAVAPFGGVKQSGLGREGSRHGLDDYMEIKYICMGGI